MDQRYNIISGLRIICLLMALYVVNLSIGVRDTAMLTAKIAGTYNELSINEIERIGEFLLEECLHMHNVIPEQDDPDEESELTELEQDFDFTTLFAFAPLLPTVQHLLSDSVPFRVELVSVHVLEIHAPPPQFA